MVRGVGIVLLALSLGACGNLARDIIVEKTLADSSDIADAGAPAPPEAPDATSPTSSQPRTRCSEDGGCEPVRCTLRDCSPACPLGCSGPIPSTSTSGQRMRIHRRREVYP